MIEPKEFYIKLDALLCKIGSVRSGTDFLFILINEIERTFGEDLHIGSGRIYEKKGDEFILISDLSTNEPVNIKRVLVMNSTEVQSILNSKTYIFDNSLFSIGDVHKKEYAIPAAISIFNRQRSWILLFELRSGWIREEIEFCLNAVRSILNYRLVTDSVKNLYEQAFQIQKSLLPISSPEINGYEIAGKSRQAQLVGGDIFDYYKFSDDEFGFCIGDASGHGIPAALMARDVIIGLRMGMENQKKMVHTLKKLNRVIYQNAHLSRFISLFYAEIEKDGSMFYVNAGHPSPILINADKITEIESTGLVFGALKENHITRSYTLLSPGSILVLFTDGIIERQNSTGKEFGTYLLKETINKHRNLHAGEILNAIFDNAQKYGKDKKWKDDATVIVIKRTPAVINSALN